MTNIILLGKKDNQKLLTKTIKVLKKHLTVYEWKEKGMVQHSNKGKEVVLIETETVENIELDFAIILFKEEVRAEQTGWKIKEAIGVIGSENKEGIVLSRKKEISLLSTGCNGKDTLSFSSNKEKGWGSVSVLRPFETIDKEKVEPCDIQVSYQEGEESMVLKVLGVLLLITKEIEEEKRIEF